MPTENADTIYGTTGDNRIDALGGNDTIYASSGQDIIDGGSGTDLLWVLPYNSSFFDPTPWGPRTYYIFNGNVIDSTATLTMSFTSIERINLYTASNIFSTSAAYDDTINASNFTSSASGTVLTLSLGSGNDIVIGSAYNDLVYAGFGSNTVDAGGGNDAVGVVFDNSNPATLYVTSSGNSVITTQGSVTNSITNAETIYLISKDGGPAVTIDASGYVPVAGTLIYFDDHNGSDTFIGSAGNDFFSNHNNGVLGNDTYTGNGGADIFDYTYAVNGMNGDTITDLDADDVIDLSHNTIGDNGGYLANQFIGTAAFSLTPGEYRYQIVGNTTLVQVDENGDGVADETLTISNGAFALRESVPGSNMLMIDQPADAQDDSFTTTELGIVNGNVLADNGDGADNDPDGPALSISAVNGDPDAVGTQITLPSGALLTLNADGSFTYDPNGAFEYTPTPGSGATNTPLADTFSYTLAGGDSATVIFTINGVDNDDTILGSDNDDFLTGGLGNDVILGGDGNDTIRGDFGDFNNTVSGNDLLDGGAGNDFLRGGLGDDQLFGGENNDLLRGGGGTDYYDGGADDGLGYNGIGDRVGFYDPLATQGVVADLRTGVVSNDGYGNVETMVGIESLGAGTAFSDTFYGDDNANFIAGDLGDNLYGFGGDDHFQLGAAPAVLDGGTGTDTVNLYTTGGGYLPDADNDGVAEIAPAATAGWSVALNAGTMIDGYGNSGSITGIENVNGSDLNDSFIGNFADNILHGGAGSDFLQGRGGNDQLFGDDGDDYLSGGIGDDLLDGGAGVDRAAFANQASAGVTVDLRIQGVAQNTGLGMDTLVGIENLSGTVFADTLIGNDAANYIWGVSDGPGAGDTIQANGGDDLVEVGAGDHVLDGGTGNDTLLFNPFGLEFGGTNSGATISLALQGAAQDTGAGMMTLTNFENLSGSDYADTLIGDGNANTLGGGQGNDTLLGGGGNDSLYGDGLMLTNGNGNSGSITFYPDVATLGGVDGNDTLEGGQGDDVIDGGGGIDTASYANASGDVQVFLYKNGNGNGESAGADGFDLLYNIENLTGSAFNDQLGGNNLNNVIMGGDGHDGLRGNGGNDSLYGGDGDDFLNGSAGDDYIDGGAGNDRAGFYEDATSAGVTVDLNLQGVAQDTGQGMDTLVNIENVSGSRYGDHLTGDDNDNWLWGSASTLNGVVSADNNDTLIGNGGNDLLIVGIGNHILDGGTGTDTVWFSENGAPETGITLSLLLQGAAQATGNGSWTLSNIENLSGSLANDNLTGDGNANVLAGSLGDDVLSGGAGNDTLYGDGQISWDGHGTGGSGPITTYVDVTGNYVGGVAGNDMLEGGLGNDLIDGAGGVDTASYAHASGSVTVDLDAGTATGADGDDTLANIENVVGSAFDDTLAGNGADNVLSGGDGADFVRGGDGNDSVLGGNGNDILKGQLGDDIIDGGAGIDRAGYYHANAALGGVTVSLLLQGSAQNVGALGWDTLTNIENVFGTPFADVMTGDANDNWLSGSEATISAGDVSASNNDYLDGGAGNDLLTVGIGNHTIIGGTGSDTLWFSENGFAETGIVVSLALQGSAQATGNGSWTLSGIENLTGSVANDTLTGDGNANVLGGGAGSDTLIGGAGNDTLYGDGGIAIDGHDVITTFTDVAAIVPGGIGSDVAMMPGVDGNDLLEGGLGDDLLNGGGGTDTASYEHASGAVQVDLGSGQSSGADGNDSLIGIENLIGSAFADDLTGDGGANAIDGRGGNDFIAGGAGDDTIHGGDGDDFVQGDFGENNISVTGNDTLYGDAGNDSLRGGLGNDFLYGGSGNDLLRGNGGVDYFDGGTDDGLGFNGIGDRVSFYEQRATQGAVADLRTGIISNDGFGNVETMVNIESLGAGTAYADTFYGNDSSNFLAADVGDQAYGFGGDDVFQLASAPSIVDGGAGIDRLSLFIATLLAPDSNGDGLAETVAAATSGFVVNLGAGTITDGYGNSGSVTGIENVDGTNLNDTLIGEIGVNALNGGDGNDTLEGRQGNDTLDGGNGIDTASYAQASGAVTVTLTAGGAGTSSGADGNDVLAGIENLTGGSFNDVLNGNNDANTLDGGDGHDKLSGAGGNDTLLGGNGDDTLTGGAGNDVINGGAGYDRAAYFGASTGVTVSLAIAGAQNTVGAGTDTLIGIENLTGTQYSDTLIGDGNDNWLWGFATTAGTANNDTLDGGGGNDLLWAGNGNMTLLGGSGNDTVMYNQNFSGDVAVKISLAVAGAQNTGQGTWTLTGIENLVGGTANDTLTGDGNANILAGGAGTDTIDGGAGADTIYGDGEITFDDHGTGGSGPIIIVPDAIATYGGVAGADILSGGDGDDFIYGGGGNDIIKGDKDNDTLYGGTGNDTMTGGQGIDRYVIEANSGADTISGFAHLVDKIVFDDSSGVTSYAQLTLTKVGTNTLVSWGNGNSITLTGVKPADLSAADFQFNPAAAGYEHVSHDFATNYATPHDIFL